MVELRRKSCWRRGSRRGEGTQKKKNEKTVGVYKRTPRANTVPQESLGVQPGSERGMEAMDMDAELTGELGKECGAVDQPRGNQ